MYSFVSSRFPNACRVLTPLSESRILRSYWLQRFVNVRLCVDNKTRRYIKKIKLPLSVILVPPLKMTTTTASLFSRCHSSSLNFKCELESPAKTRLFSPATGRHVVRSLKAWRVRCSSDDPGIVSHSVVITDHTEICSASTCLTSLCSVSA